MNVREMQWYSHILLHNGPFSLRRIKYHYFRRVTAMSSVFHYIAPTLTTIKSLYHLMHSVFGDSSSAVLPLLLYIYRLNNGFSLLPLTILPLFSGRMQTLPGNCEAVTRLRALLVNFRLAGLSSWYFEFKDSRTVLANFWNFYRPIAKAEMWLSNFQLGPRNTGIYFKC